MNAVRFVVWIDNGWKSSSRPGSARGRSRPGSALGRRRCVTGWRGTASSLVPAPDVVRTRMRDRREVVTSRSSARFTDERHTACAPISASPVSVVDPSPLPVAGGGSKNSSSERRAAVAGCVAIADRMPRWSSTTSTRPASGSAWRKAARHARWPERGKRPETACYSAPTATRRWRPEPRFWHCLRCRSRSGVAQSVERSAVNR